jgi:hypothetical protein
MRRFIVPLLFVFVLSALLPTYAQPVFGPILKNLYPAPSPICAGCTDTGLGVWLSTINYVTTFPGSWQTVNYTDPVGNVCGSAGATCQVTEFVGNEGGAQIQTGLCTPSASFTGCGGFEFLGWNPSTNVPEWLYIGPQGAWVGFFFSEQPANTGQTTFWDPLGDLAKIENNELPCLHSTPLPNNGGCTGTTAFGPFFPYVTFRTIAGSAMIMNGWPESMLRDCQSSWNDVHWPLMQCDP